MRRFVTVLSFLAAAFFLAVPVTLSNPEHENPATAKGYEHSIRLDGTITLGNLLTAATFIVGIIGTYAAFKARFATLELKVETLWKAWLKEHNRNDES